MKNILRTITIVFFLTACSTNEKQEETPQIVNNSEHLKLGLYNRSLLSACPQIGLTCASEFMNPTISKDYETFDYSPSDKTIKIIFFKENGVPIDIVNFENITKLKEHHYVGNNGIEFGTYGKGLKIVRKNSNIIEIYKPY
ncbi:hypothetical protein QLS91_02295 [Flavobacterium sp. LB2P84]|uniref:hypothetical protein n=1 Tax=Flavobacterium yafengii TaxID=3041253 RepID=UPI0024A85001|nr:hypothetical protein [Flavobacterium yafengii]MDI6031896.1 hypothetical protein [Flavobacterium yafengii]